MRIVLKMLMMFVRKQQLEVKLLCEDCIATPKPMLFTVTNSQSFTSATTCHIWTIPPGEDKKRARCHITGNYRGTAHNECKLNYTIKPRSWKLSVEIHNLKGYDGHLTESREACKDS